MISGTFSTAATLVPIYISLPCGYDYIEILNLTDFGSVAANTHTMIARGYSSLPDGYALYIPKTNGAATFGTQTMTLTGGFSFIADSAAQPLGVPIAITAITAANPPVASSATTGSIGDIVRLYGTTGMLQISTMDFTVTAVNAGVSQSFGYLVAAGGFAAPATAGFYRKLPFDEGRFYPRSRYITAISQANPAVIQFSVTHKFVVGEKLRINIPSGWGMPQMNGLLVTVVAVNTATNTITTDIDSSLFTAFAFPTSAVAATGISFPMAIPIGETAAAPYGALFDDSRLNDSFTGVKIDTTVLDASVTYSYRAYKGLHI
jgi:hypothetical protein